MAGKGERKRGREGRRSGRWREQGLKSGRRDEGGWRNGNGGRKDGRRRKQDRWDRKG